MESNTAKPRKLWLAALLSLFSGALGQIYCGHFRRGIILWLVFLFIIQVPVISCAATLPLGRIGFLLLLLSVPAYIIFMCVDAFLLAKRHRTRPLKQYQKWWLYLLFFIIHASINNGFAHGIKAVVTEAFVISSGGMSPTLQPGDKILVDKLWFNPKYLKRNTIVVFHSDGPNSPPYAMRVVGLPGDEIEIKEEEVLVNGTKWADEHVNLTGPVWGPLANYGPVRVPTDSFFVLGDNRRNVQDSRVDGPILLSDLIGKANMIYWSRERIFPVPRDKSKYERGPIAWDRIGIYLD